MAKKILGDACAFIPAAPGGKNRYTKIGIALTDGDRISLKLDTLPIPGAGWEGWVNIFPIAGTRRVVEDDDIPV